MKYGSCIGDDPKKIAPAKAYGYDYVEVSFQFLGRGSDEDFSVFRDTLLDAGMPCPSANLFLPADLRISVEEPDLPAVRAYVEKGFRRGAEIGLQKVVFGSGGARDIPAGRTYIEAARSIRDVLHKVVCPLAEAYGITVLVEPLSESNIFNRVKEAAAFASSVESPSVAVLADLYHMGIQNDDPADILLIGKDLRHAHIANPDFRDGERRGYPLDAGEYDYAAFLRALDDAGCETCSVEANTKDFEKDAPAAIRVLRSIL